MVPGELVTAQAKKFQNAVYLLIQSACVRSKRLDETHSLAVESEGMLLEQNMRVSVDGSEWSAQHVRCRIGNSSQFPVCHRKRTCTLIEYYVQSGYLARPPFDNKCRRRECERCQREKHTVKDQVPIPYLKNAADVDALRYIQRKANDLPIGGETVYTVNG